MDWIDEVSAAWEREFPNADTRPLKTITRLVQASVLLRAFQEDVLRPLGLVMSDFTVLAALRRLGAPYQASPSELYSLLERSSGGMTKMIKRLDAQGLVERLPDPSDGRSSLVRLTSKGLSVHEKTFNAFLDASHALFPNLAPGRMKEIDQSLQHLVQSFEGYFYR